MPAQGRVIAKAERCVSNSTPFTHVVALGDELYSLKRFDEAASIYKRVADPSLDTPLTFRFLSACYQAGKMDEALQVCRRLRQKHGPLRYTIEMESAIYEDIGDLAASGKVCEEFLAVDPADGSIRVRLAVVHLRQRNLDAVDKFLADRPAWESLPVNFAIQIANLLAVRERYREAMELIYQIRRRHPEGKVHLRYLHSFLFHGGDKHEWLDANEVAVNTAVCVEDAGGKRQWFILEGHDDARIEAGELMKDHRLWRELLGKRVGDSILLRESSFAPEHGKLVEITSKYVHAFHECGETLQTRYPEIKGFEAVHLPPDEDAGIKKILEQVGNQQDAQDRAFKIYHENQIPISALAHFIGRNVFEAWSAIINEKSAQLHCCIGSAEERLTALEHLRGPNAPTLVVDPVALMTLDAIGIGDDVVRITGRLGIAQPTIDLLSDTLHKRKAVNRDGFMGLSREGDQFVRREVTSEEVEQVLAWLDNLLLWISANCVVLPWSPSLKVNRAEREHLSEMLGEESVDTILVSASGQRLLYSDDQRLRALAKGEFGVDGVWTQTILLKGLNEGALTREKYNVATIGMICSGYKHTTVDGQVLLAAARKAQWRPASPYEQVAKVLGGDECDEDSAVRVAVDFIYELWKETILPESFDYLVLRVFDALAHGRPRQRLIARLVEGIKRRFLVLPVVEEQLLRAVSAWSSLRPSW